MASILPYPFADQLTVLLFALLLSALWFVPDRYQAQIEAYSPKKLFQILANRLSLRLNRPERSVSSLRGRGAVSLLILWGISLILFSMFASLVQALYAGVVLEIILVAALMPTQLLYRKLKNLAQLVEHSRAEAISYAVEAYTGRKYLVEDRHAALRFAIEDTATRLAERVILQGVFYLLLGLPGLGFVWLLVWLSRRWPPTDSHYKHFSYWLGKSLLWLMWLPSRLAATLIAFSSLLVAGAKPLRALQAWMNMPTDIAVAPHVQAMAAACNVSLGGARVVSGSLQSKGWAGEGTAKVGLADAERAGKLYITSVFCLSLALAFWRLALFA